MPPLVSILLCAHVSGTSESSNGYTVVFPKYKVAFVPNPIVGVSIVI
jgi:hypothetical protein